MKADDNRKVTLYLHSRGQRLFAVLKLKVDFMHRVADKDGMKKPRVGETPDASALGKLACANILRKPLCCYRAAFITNF